MKAFNLQEAINGAKLVTRDGREVSGFTYFEAARLSAHPCAAIVDSDLLTFTYTGRFNDDTTGESQYDLFLAPVETTEYVNLVRWDDGKIEMGGKNECLGEAILVHTSNAVCVLKLTTINGKTTAEIVHTY